MQSVEHFRFTSVVTLERSAVGSGFVADSQTVKVEVIRVNEQSVRVRLYDPNERRYEVPIPVLDVLYEKSIDKPLYRVKITENGFLVIVRQKTSSAVFKTDLKRLVFSDQFLQLSSDLPSDHIYGLGMSWCDK